MTRSKKLLAGGLVVAGALFGASRFVTLPSGGLSHWILIKARAVVMYDARELRFGILENARPRNPTALRFGPDGRLYVAEQHGRILAYSIERRGPGEFHVAATEVIEDILQILNHNDDGSPMPSVQGRLVTGLETAGSAEQPVVYVTSSDPRIHDEDADTNSGIVSRLTWRASSWTRDDLIRGLPRSRVDHGPNGLWLNESTGLLYLTVGGNTNSGAPSGQFHLLPEYALSAAILEIDLANLLTVPYDLPTLDDEERPGPDDAGDPFGGNGGKNQAILADDGPVRLYASGFRNAFRVTGAAGALFTIDNGANQNYGGPPVWRDGRVTNEPTGPIDRLPSVLLRIGNRGYYGGHPNPVRADRRIIFNDTDPQSPIAAERPEEAHFLPPGRKPGELMHFYRSVNGIVTYHSSVFGEEWRGSLLIAGWGRIFRLVRVSQEGDIVAERILVRQGGFLPLDVTAQDESGEFPGSIWAADYGANGVTVIEPVRESGILALPAAIGRDLLVGGTERALEWARN